MCDGRLPIPPGRAAEGHRREGDPADLLRSAARLSPDARFRLYHDDHPEVFELFTRLARQARAQGFDRYSARAILHRIRWHYHVERGTRDFRINDHWSPYYARLLMQTDPGFAGFFELRESAAERSGDGTV